MMNAQQSRRPKRRPRPSRLAVAFGGLVVLASAALLGPAPAEAGEKRRILEAEWSQWLGLGRLDVAAGALCTATMISDRLAVTAAHCVTEPQTRTPLHGNRMTFRPGFRYGRAAGATRVARVATPPADPSGDPCSAAALATDIALIEFADPVPRDRATAFAAGSAPQSASLSVVSYGGGNAAAPTLETGCRSILRGGGLQVIDCEAEDGASGAPALAEIDGRTTVIGVVLADARCDPTPAALIVEIAPHLDALLAQLGLRLP